MKKLKDLLHIPLDKNTYLVNAQLQDGWMPVGGLCLSMLPANFQKEWADILESSVEKISKDGAYGKEIHLTGIDENRLHNFPFAILPFYGLETQKNGLLSPERKANLFDGLMESVHGLMSDDSWYDIFRGIGMSDEEMRSTGLGLPELKVTEHAMEEMVEYVVNQIKGAKLEGKQTHINVSIDDLTSRFGIDLESCALAEDMFMEELYSHDEIVDAEITSGSLRIKPDERTIIRGSMVHEPVMGM